MEPKNVTGLSQLLRSLAGPAIILLASVVAVGPLLLSGPSCRGDLGFHLVSWMDAGRSMKAGVLYPHWANSSNFGAGEPKFVFYPPITWMAGAVLGMILPWKAVPPVLFILLLAATGMGTRAWARTALPDETATLAGCAAVFVGYALFNIYRRNDFSEMTGGFWIPLLLLFALRRQSPSGSFLERTFDGSAAPLALVVAGMWLSNGPLGIMGSYLLAAVALVSAVMEKSLVPLARVVASTVGGLGLASLYLIPAVWESKWASIESAMRAGEYRVENNWLFALDADPQVAAHQTILFQVSKIAILMLAIAFAGGAIAWFRGVVPGERKFWLPMALIPPAVLFLLLPVSAPVWHVLPEMRLLQFSWRWLVALEAPMAIWFASALRFERRNARIAVIAGCAAAFVAVSLAAPRWWLVSCGSLIASTEESVQEGVGVIGKPEYAPPGIQSAILGFELDDRGVPVQDAQGNLIVQGVPDACLLDNPAEVPAHGEPDSGPAWRGDPATCKSEGWHGVALYANPAAPGAGQKPEQKWFAGVAGHAGTLILRLRYFPAWTVRVNGYPVTAVAEHERGLTAVPVPKGNVLVSADWTTTADVVAGRWSTGVALLLVGGLYFFERKRQRSSSPEPGSSRSGRESMPPTRGVERHAPSARPDRQAATSAQAGRKKRSRRPRRGR